MTPKSLFTGLALAALAAGGPTGPAQAAPLVLDDFSGGETVLTFDDLADVPEDGPLTLSGMIFTDISSAGGSGAGSPGLRLARDFFVPGSSALADLVAVSHLQIDLPGRPQRAGLLLGAGPAEYEISFFGSGGALLDRRAFQFDDDPRAHSFAGFESVGGIERIRIRETTPDNGRSLVIDDLRFESLDQGEPVSPVPLPAGVAQILTALTSMVGLSLARRRNAWRSGWSG